MPQPGAGSRWLRGNHDPVEGTQLAESSVLRPPICRQSPVKSGSGEIARQFALEFGKVTGDHRDVEMREDRLLGLAVKQELERGCDAMLRRMRAHRQSLASVSCQSDVMARFAAPHTDDDIESEWIAVANSFDLDHSTSSP